MSSVVGIMLVIYTCSGCAGNGRSQAAEAARTCRGIFQAVQCCVVHAEGGRAPPARAPRARPAAAQPGAPPAPWRPPAARQLPPARRAPLRRRLLAPRPLCCRPLRPCSRRQDGHCDAVIGRYQTCCVFGQGGASSTLYRRQGVTCRGRLRAARGRPRARRPGTVRTKTPPPVAAAPAARRPCEPPAAWRPQCPVPCVHGNQHLFETSAYGIIKYCKIIAEMKKI